MNPGENPSTVMIIDDTPANLRLLQTHFHNLDYKVLAFRSGEAALEAANLNPPDIILLDINMPEMDGFEVCDRLKKDQTLKEIPVLFISALSETQDKIKAFQSGGIDYVTKPFQMEEVTARVGTHLRLRKNERQLREAYEALQKLEDLRDSFVHMLVHDLRSPLSGIHGVFQLIELEDTEQVGKLIEEGKRQTMRLVEMISTVLDVSRMESDAMKPSLSTVDLQVLIWDAIGNLATVMEGRKIINTMGAAISISCDTGLISRVLQNLLSNAISHTDSNKGEIMVTVSAEHEVVRVGIKDNGRGIPEEYLETIFEKFGQVSSRRYSSGLGLTFCRLAVQAHGGEIGVESQLGKGSSFWFSLPK